MSLRWFLGFCSSTSKRLTTSSAESMSTNLTGNMYDAQPSVRGALTSSSFSSLSSMTPTPFHFLSLALAFSVTINKEKLNWVPKNPIPHPSPPPGLRLPLRTPPPLSSCDYSCDCETMWILSTSNFSLVSFLKTSSTGFLSTLLPIKITFSKCLFKKDSLCESERDSFPLLSYNLFTNFPFVVLSLFPVTLVVPVLLSCAPASTIVSVCVTQAVPALPSRASVSTIAFACVTGDSISVSGYVRGHGYQVIWVKLHWD